jgi:hypothetical protein
MMHVKLHAGGRCCKKSKICSKRLKPKLKEELQRMVDLNIIEPVEKQTE